MQRTPTSERKGASRSLWMATADPPVFAPLSADAHARVCIVGAGIAGLTTAYRLARAGVDVVVLEEGDLHDGQTARTTGHLCDALDDRYCRLEQLHGVVERDDAVVVSGNHQDRRLHPPDSFD